jgi:predicted metalloenzyme YecM
MQRDRLVARGIDIAPYSLSHLAVRVADWDMYVHQRTLLERHASANRESVWNGRPISLIVLAEPLDVLDGKPVSRIELIPPVHQRVYRMGLEHLGVVVGEEIDEFSRLHRAALTGQQFQSLNVEPVYVLFEDFTHVKFYRRSFFDVVEDEEGRFEGFSHVDDWVPQRLVTATGPNPLPR